MKKAKRENLMKKIAVAALLMGIYSPMAEAALSPKDGLSYSELTKIVRDLEIQEDGMTIRFAGVMPKRCAESFIPTSPEFVDGKHILKFSMPACENNFQPVADEEMVDAADYLNDVKLAKDLDGPLVVQYYKEGSRNASDRIQQDVIENHDHKSQATLTQETLDAENAKKQKARDAEALQDQKDNLARLLDLQKQVTGYCLSGDAVGLGSAIEGAADILDDVTGLLAKVDDSQKKSLTDALADAGSAEDAKLAYDEYVNAALLKGWDTDALKKDYIAKRFDLLDALTADAQADEAKSSKVDRALQDWIKDLRSFDRKEFKARQGDFGKVYAQLGTQAANHGSVDQAVSYYDKAKSYTDAKGKISIDGDVIKLYAKEYKECLAKNPTQMNVCDKYKEQMQARAQNIGDTLAEVGGEEEVKAYKAEYIQNFGGGPTVSMPGVGSIAPYAPGALDKLKQQTYQEYMLQQQVLMQQRMMGVQVPTAAAAPASNFLGLH